MQIQKINSQNFNGINSSQACGRLMERLNNDKRYIDFSNIISRQDANPFSIELSLGKHKNIIGRIIDTDGNVLSENKENVLFGIFNLSPKRFLKKICKQADEIKKEKMKDLIV